MKLYWIFLVKFNSLWIIILRIPCCRVFWSRGDVHLSLSSLLLNFSLSYFLTDVLTNSNSPPNLSLLEYLWARGHYIWALPKVMMTARFWSLSHNNNNITFNMVHLSFNKWNHNTCSKRIVLLLAVDWNYPSNECF